MAGNNGGPWGGGGGSGGDDDRDRGDRGNGQRRPGQDGPRSEIDDLMKKGQEQLRVLMGGRGGGGGDQGGPGGGEPFPTRIVVGIAAIVAVIGWAMASFYVVRPEERSVELFLGEFSSIGQPGLNFAPWPLVTAEVIAVTRENTEDIGVGNQRGTSGLMLTTDENIVDIDFQVVWTIDDPSMFLFNLADGQQTVRAVSESAMREIVAQSELAPILNRDRELVAATVLELIQTTLDGYDSGINIVRVNLDRADPPAEVIDAFREVQAAEQERDRLERQADAYANRVLAGARGEAAQVLEEALGYSARVVNEAQGEASRFLAVLEEYEQAPEVTRKRLYLETMERVFSDVEKVILDSNSEGGQGVVPYLPLNELRRNSAATGGN
ncbi:FtsH protease activity modulator HflK [Parasulfitobacter algicola]|uniref:Protein HflK n=1 Tax=Parasulfitobacter algicola TaxID=2614809 RepID=A0ABX2IXA0_9RHOB|nr:FtsH protease activity modulator HflK [Sulfitobacter algicola]NSX55041.1 FtsH protease activity modulator HflK [Sulfitobacter algicola]